MSEEYTNEQLREQELEMFRDQCKTMGITFHHKAGVDTLKGLIEEHTKVREPEKELTEVEVTAQLRKSCERLRRVVVTCKDPQKQSWKGEWVSGSNSAVSPVKKYVPFDIDAGFHVPQLLLNVLEDREYRRKSTDGRDASSGGMAKAYHIEYLDALTASEIQELARQQKLRNGQLD